jgi:hypothetical protein
MIRGSYTVEHYYKPANFSSPVFSVASELFHSTIKSNSSSFMRDRDIRTAYFHNGRRDAARDLAEQQQSKAVRGSLAPYTDSHYREIGRTIRAMSINRPRPYLENV